MLKKDLERNKKLIISILKTVLTDPETYTNPQHLAKFILKEIYDEEI